MKKIATFIFAALSCFACHAYEGNRENYLTKDITDQIPEITRHSQFKKIPNVAQYKEADWSGVIGIARGISLSEAFKIAEENSDITFFFHMKGGQMILEKTDGTYRVFSHGDTVFFSGEPWWGSAPGFSDGYIRR